VKARTAFRAPAGILAAVAMLALCPRPALAAQASAGGARPVAVAEANGSGPARVSPLPGSRPGLAPRAASASASAGPGNYCANGSTFTGNVLYNLNSGKVLEVYNSNTSDGAEVDQWSYDATATQYWCGVVTGYWDGYTIYNIVNDNSGKCLDLTLDNTADGTHLQQWTCNGNEQQDWMARPAMTYGPNGWYSNGYWTWAVVTERASFTAYPYCMEVYNWSTSDGATIDLWTNDEGANQQWSA
jgi:hypothetical protein